MLEFITRTTLQEYIGWLLPPCGAGRTYDSLLITTIWSLQCRHAHRHSYLELVRMPVTRSPTLSSSESGSTLNGQMVPLNCFLTGALRRGRRDQDDGLDLCPPLQGTNIDVGRGQCKVKIFRLEISTSQHFPSSPANLYLPAHSTWDSLCRSEHIVWVFIMVASWLLFLCYFDPSQ